MEEGEGGDAERGEEEELLLRERSTGSTWVEMRVWPSDWAVVV